MTGPGGAARALVWARAKVAAMSVAGLVVVILLVAWALRSCAPTPPPKIPPKDQASIDSLKRTDSTFRARQDSLRTVIVHDTVKVTRLVQSAAVSRANADRLGRQADSIAMLARAATTAADSARRWHEAFDTRGLAIDSLHVTIAKGDSALTHERDVATGYRLLYEGDTARRVATEHLKDNLIKDIAKLQQPCRLIGPIPCPSRIVTGVAAAAIGVLAGRTSKP